MISGYLGGRTFLHRLPAGLKLAALAVLSLLILPLDDPRLLGCALAVTLAVYAGLGRPALARLGMLRPLLPLLALMVLLQAWSGDWTGAGFAAGVASVLRILLMVLLADLVTLSTPLQQMMDVLETILTPLRPLGASPRKLALAVALVLRFVPVLLASWRGREEAWRARSTRRPSLALVPGFLAETLRLADHVAEALDARGFARSPGPRRRDDL